MLNLLNPYLLYIKIAVVLVIGGAIVYYVYGAEKAKGQVAVLETKYNSMSEKYTDMVQEHNKTVELYESEIFKAEQLRSEISTLHEALTDGLSRIRSVAAEEKSKYDRGNLKLITKEKSSLITRYAKRAAQERNKEWEELSNTQLE